MNSSFGAWASRAIWASEVTPGRDDLSHPPALPEHHRVFGELPRLRIHGPAPARSEALIQQVASIHDHLSKLQQLAQVETARPDPEDQRHRLSACPGR